MRNGAQIVLECLRAEGVNLAFGYPGGAIMPLYDALEGSGISHVLMRHEQGAVFAAEGYARATGRVGVAIATSGPGATNLVTGIASAYLNHVPVVVINTLVDAPADPAGTLLGGLTAPAAPLGLYIPSNNILTGFGVFTDAGDPKPAACALSTLWGGPLRC